MSGDLPVICKSGCMVLEVQPQFQEWAAEFDSSCQPLFFSMHRARVNPEANRGYGGKLSRNLRQNRWEPTYPPTHPCALLPQFRHRR